MQIQCFGRTNPAPTLEQAAGLLAEALGDLRGALFELTPALLHGSGLDAALRYLAEETEVRSGIETRFAAPGPEPALGETARTVLYLGARELAVNAVKHAGAGSLLIERLCGPGTVAVRVSDDGRGCDPHILERVHRDGGHFGLVNLERRLTALGGSIDIASVSGGTRVTLVLPYEPRTHDHQTTDRG